MNGVNEFEMNYPLHTDEGMERFLEDYAKLAELRFETTNYDLCDFLLDFEKAVELSMTARQKEIFNLCYMKDMRQEDVAKVLGVSQQIVQRTAKIAVKYLVEYHVNEVKRGELDGL